MILMNAERRTQNEELRSGAESLRSAFFVLRSAFMVSVAVLLSCSGSKQAPPEEKIPVTVAIATQKDIPVQIRTIGNVQPISTVGVRAQVSGELLSVSFREGDEVSKGQLLFKIDPRPFQAVLSQAEANLVKECRRGRLRRGGELYVEDMYADLIVA